MEVRKAGEVEGRQVAQQKQFHIKYVRINRLLAFLERFFHSCHVFLPLFEVFSTGYLMQIFHPHYSHEFLKSFHRQMMHFLLSFNRGTPRRNIEE